MKTFLWSNNSKNKYTILVTQKDGEIALYFSLLSSLRQGGYILYARHAEATIGEDLPSLDFNNCITQRNLSEYGRRQAVYYGELIRILKIPVNYPVFASPYCRTIETAQLAFSQSYVAIDSFLHEINLLSENASLADQTRIISSLNARLELLPPQGVNQFYIAHSFPDNVGLGEIPYMGTVVIRPLGPGKGYEAIAKLSLQEFAGLT